MHLLNFTKRTLIAAFTLFWVHPPGATAQTDIDAIMMNKNNFCVGGTYGNNSWKNYWEGTFKRNNLNLGTVSTKTFGLMGNYGITDKLNFLVGLPYVETHASAGTLHGQKGLQDLSMWLKWLALEQQIGSGTLSLYAIGGLSLPVSHYEPAFLPMSIGLHSTNLSGRVMADYQTGNFFVTASGTYTWRSDITIDQNSYYTTELYLTDKVYMPNMASYNVRAGYRSERLIAEAVFDQMYTLGGFDIRKNDMPFPSNKMNATTAGVNFKYTFKAVDGLSLVGGGDYTLAGRNVGQATAWDIGVFYILSFTHKGKKSSQGQKPAQPSSKTN
ncbi:MAG: hypothetical protein P4L51_21755 [Puia sp.]|nr:hypothetical protein [Puia sp.]